MSQAKGSKEINTSQDEPWTVEYLGEGMPSRA